MNVGSGQFSGSGAHRFHASHPRPAGAGAGSQDSWPEKNLGADFERSDRDLSLALDPVRRGEPRASAEQPGEQPLVTYSSGYVG
jgi:hypothetical protein